LSVLRIETPAVFEPLLQPARYKGAYGGRGSAKSHHFAEAMVERAMMAPGFRGLCIREVQKTLKDSAKKLIEDKILALGVGALFEPQRDRIITPGGGQIAFLGMAEHTAESVKSLEGYDVAWTEEAQALSHRSLTLLRPTIRKPGSELWFSWNPTRKSDAVDELLRGEVLPPGAVVVRSNWRDNPWFPPELEAERAFDARHRPEQYPHVWEGEYARVFEGAYYAEALTSARAEGRIGTVAADLLIRRRAFWDLGVKDSTAIWVAQFVGREIRLIDFIEGQGQALAFYVEALRARGHGSALCVLPHDGARRDAVAATAFEEHLRQAGFEVMTIRNQGKGAAMLRIEAARRLTP
jgi:phage terminase large subunit